MTPMVWRAFKASSALAIMLASAAGAPEGGAEAFPVELIMGGGFMGIERAADKVPIRLAIEDALAGVIIARWGAEGDGAATGSGAGGAAQMLDASLESRVGPNPASSFEGLRFRFTPSSRGREDGGGAEGAATEAAAGVDVVSFSRAL